MKVTNPALVLGMFETGLGVVRSLGRAGIKVFGFDFKKDIGFCSKYAMTRICPHPLDESDDFVAFMLEFAGTRSEKPVLFLTADDFLLAVSRNREKLSRHFLFNIPTQETIEAISNKYRQHALAVSAGVSTPKTYCFHSLFEADRETNIISYPVILKAREVNAWKKVLGGSIKGFIASDSIELKKHLGNLLEKGIEVIVQEVIPGPDTNHFKFCGYAGKDGELLLKFTLRKIRQNPIHYGVGAVVESVAYPELVRLGEDFFRAIAYRGVGSAEFKLDERDGKLKLIELNPRYWQQNSLAVACGMDFPLIDYLELTDQKPGPVETFTTGIKWVNRYMDFNSFLDYRKEGTLSFRSWRRSLAGRKVYSDFAWDDPLPAFYEIGFGKKLLRLPRYLIRRWRDA